MILKNSVSNSTYMKRKKTFTSAIVNRSVLQMKGRTCLVRILLLIPSNNGIDGGGSKIYKCQSHHHNGSPPFVHVCNVIYKRTRSYMQTFQILQF